MRTWDVIRIRIDTLVWAVLALVLFLGGSVLLGASPLVLAAAVGLGIVLGLIVWLLARLVVRGARRPGRGFLLRACAGFAALAVGLVAAPIYWLALVVGLDPLALPKATLSNGEKTVVFQGMTHIGSEPFYKSVVYDLEEALVDGYALFYEGVQPGDAESDAWFAEKLAGGNDLGENYAKLAETCGLKFQLDYFALLGPEIAARPDRNIVADVSTADMLAEWRRLTAEDPSLETRTEDAGGFADIPLEEIVGWVETLDTRQRELVGVVCRGIFTTALRDSASVNPEDDDADGGEGGPMDPVVLDYRNRKLAERIAEFSGDRIYVTYGSGHLKGLIAELKAIDPTWELKSVSWTRAIAAPEELEGDL